MNKKKKKTQATNKSLDMLRDKKFAFKCSEC